MAFTPSANEQQLVKHLRAGGHAAFDALFHAYSGKLYRFTFSYLKSKEDAEEIVQETFTKVWVMRNELDPERSFSSFLFTLTYHAILNTLRKRKNGDKAMQLHAAKFPKFHQHIEEDLMANEVEQHAHMAIASMPSQRKKIFLMSREKHLTGEEIANELNLSPKTVEAQMTLAIKFLRKYFAQLGIT